MSAPLYSYPYRTKPILAWVGLALTIPCVIGVIYQGSEVTNSDGSSVSPAVLYAVWLGLAAWVVYLLLLIYAQFSGPRSVKLTATALRTPKFPWSNTDMEIPYARIASLSIQRIRGHRLWVSMSGFKKQGLDSGMFESEAAFHDCCARLSELSGKEIG